ncbi:Alpha/beta hydrolase fold-1 [Acididesulfobacillus acetoxydans]|uniref:Alpha/beta hydrolase fold n=1 Tax=Acididesulfobacillus acetoxydans TaxID=1561005 RepID=A0A8S0VVF9_9FIRM|nr:alpha/beta fold hydrolase [Acididesulfobacillus acetoxydans]CAA7599413.1 Alpha/beta hydrolase fold-1 [Acididesulfobacillus acetoxydans]CEJ06781.1 Alpha/beta hydrolase fold [Acididesulfobacillus acetoxydans]
MPKCLINGIELYYEIHGSGEPVLLIEGLGYATWQWFRQVDALAKSYRIVIFDNRGVGESEKPDEPYSIDLMADDAAALLTQLGFAKAHVLGTSMGGFIAQKLALRHQEQVCSLVLACTSFGGPRSLPITAEALDSMQKIAGLTPAEVIRQGFRAAFSSGFMAREPGLVERLVDRRLNKPTPRFAWERQFAAGAGFAAESDLGQIRVPTLVLAGSEDIVIPPQNSALLAERIPGARLLIFPEAGHLFFIEQAEEFNRQVLGFWRESGCSKG